MRTLLTACIGLLLLAETIMGADPAPPSPVPQPAAPANPPSPSANSECPLPPPPEPVTIKRLVAQHKELVPTLSAALEDSDSQVRQMAMRTLYKLNQETGEQKKFIPTLITALKDCDAGVRTTAAGILLQIGKEAVPALQQALKDKDLEIRANTAQVLGQLGADGRDAIPALIATMKDEDKEVRRRVVFALDRIVTGIPVVIQARPASLRQASNDPGLLLPADIPAGACCPAPYYAPPPTGLPGYRNSIE